MSKHKLKKLWARYDVRVAAGVIVLAAVGLGLLAAVVWAALMLWSHDFRKRFSTWYQRWILAGLVIAWLSDYRVGALLNIPPSWVTLAIVGGCAWVALRR